MNLKELVQGAWPDHEKKTAEVADRLETGLELVEPNDADGVTAFLHVVNHTIGDHAGDRARALRVCEAAVARLQVQGNDTPWLHLAVARHLAGEEEAAQEAEGRLGREPANPVRVRMLVAQGKAHEKQWAASQALWEECLAVADGLDEGHKAERAVAVVSNNLSSMLLELEERDAAQDAWMLRTAEVGRAYWLRAGDWMNSERADYLLAGVHNALGRPEEAKTFARRALATIDENGEEDVDRAFIELSLAQAHKLLGEDDEHAAALARAKALAETFESEFLESWFAGELAKVQP